MGGIFTNTLSVLFGGAVMVWVAGILFVTSPADRMDRACSPVRGLGSVTESLMTVGGAERASIETAGSWFGKGDYACKYTLWGLFYKEDWEQATKVYTGAQETVDEKAARILRESKSQQGKHN